MAMKKKTSYPTSKQAKIKLKKDDQIELEIDGKWIGATVLSREKTSGRYYNYFNVVGEDGQSRS